MPNFIQNINDAYKSGPKSAIRKTNTLSKEAKKPMIEEKTLLNNKSGLLIYTLHRNILILPKQYALPAKLNKSLTRNFERFLDAEKKLKRHVIDLLYREQTMKYLKASQKYNQDLSHFDCQCPKTKHRNYPLAIS